jgi:hypothetical protein
MTYDPRKVVSAGFPLDDFTFTYNISGAVTQANLGAALTIDTTAASTMKLAGDGAPIHGRLQSYEDRSQQGAGKTGTVQRKFKERFPPPSVTASQSVTPSAVRPPPVTAARRSQAPIPSPISSSRRAPTSSSSNPCKERHQTNEPLLLEIARNRRPVERCARGL